MTVGKIENDVLFGHNGELFLASGGHNVTDYATGKREVDPNVVQIFSDNILTRSEIARMRNIPYMHVVTPDKQSVMTDCYVVPEPIRLAVPYIASLQEYEVTTLYPLPSLQGAEQRTFLKTDTHLTDLGSIIVATEVASHFLGQNFSGNRSALLASLTVRRNHCGDLGSKLLPKQEAEEVFSAPTWPRHYFHNRIEGGSNGGVDVVISPNAQSSKRLLWFGDSFGRELVRFLSFFFSEILFLRTPFLHPEFIDQFQPDFLVTQNVERYLASCQPDAIRPAFHMFPFLNGRQVQPDIEFAKAFSAVLSYPRPPYATFLAELKMARAEGGSSMAPSQTDSSTKLPDAALVSSITLPETSIQKAKTYEIIPNIHPDDLIFKFVARRWGADIPGAVGNYYELGRYSSKLAAELVEEVKRVKKFLGTSWQPTSILDFASGYGNTSRHLRAYFPDAVISTCDIHDAAVTFNSDILGLKSHLSHAEPEMVQLPPSDVIVALSFFSHMPQVTFSRWLHTLSTALSPGGVLIFTANGFVTETKNTTRVVAGEDGFGFLPKSEQSDLDGAQYGITLSHPRWVFKTLEAIPGIRLARFQEGLWWAIQDTYVCIKDQ